MEWTRPFRAIGIDDVALVGGKNASLGEMLRNVDALGVRVPNGFATTAEAYRAFLRSSKLAPQIEALLEGLAEGDVEELERRSAKIRALIVAAPLPRNFERAIRDAYALLSKQYGEDAADVAVRSSATAEDLPTASFAGAQESFLNVRGADDVCDSV